jgi:hypothetical protein
LFGIFEYSRYLYVLHLTNNAARDGARYAVVNTTKPTDFDVNDYTDPFGRVYPSIHKHTRSVLGPVDSQINAQVAVFAVDPVGLSLTPPVTRPKSKNPPTYPDPFNQSDSNRVPWNSAGFGEKIGVTVKGTYRPTLPVPLILPASITVTATAIAGSEG